MENQRQIIITKLNTLQNRARNQNLLRYLTICLFFVCCVLSVLYSGIRLFPFPFSILHITIGTIGIAVVIGICLGLRRRIELTHIATIVDDYMRLKERVNTSLEVIQKNQKGEIVDLQIGDSAVAIANTDPKEIIPYVMPPLLKWLSIPIVIITLSFAVPRQYEPAKPISVAEQFAINNAIANLTEQSGSVTDTKIRAEMSDTIDKLKKVTNVNAAHQHLQTLNSNVRKYKSELPDEAAIAQSTQTTQHFKAMDATALADELNRLSEQAELTPELQEQLAKLFAKLSENIPEGKLRQTLEQLQGKTVSPNTLQEIADSLTQANQLELLEEQLIDSRKDIALASIETEQSSGDVASSDSAPGQDIGTQEVQGTQIETTSSDFNPSSNNTPSFEQNDSASKPLTGDVSPSLQITGNEMTLTSAESTEVQSITRVFTGERKDQGTAPKYLEFSEVVLSAQREYAQAIETGRIPVRYRSQIKAYLEAIAKLNER